MVRMLVGAMTAVSRGEVSLETFQAGLTERANFDCPTAPPEPLTLWSVGYPPDIDPFTPQQRESFVWPNHHHSRLQTAATTPPTVRAQGLEL